MSLMSSINKFVVQPAATPSLDYAPIIIYAGQSNCGRSRFSELSGSNSASYGQTYPGIQLYNYIYNSSSLSLLKGGINTLLINSLHADEFGMETSLAYNLSNAGIKECYFVKCGVGSTDLGGGYTGSYWGDTGSNSVASSFGLNGDVLYKSNVDFVIKSLVNLGKTPYIALFIWMQGENDAANFGEAGSYGTNLTNFFKSFDIWLHNKIVQYSLPNITNYKKIICRINGASDPTETWRELVRGAQVSYSLSASSNAIWINTDNYPLESDGVHYNAYGQLQFGNDVFTSISGSLNQYLY